jgi:hypothetical protein
MRDGFLMVEQRATADHERPPGAAILLLLGEPEAGVFEGYMVSYDREEKRLAASPYVLSRDMEPRRIEADHKSWLDGECCWLGAGK